LTTVIVASTKVVHQGVQILKFVMSFSRLLTWIGTGIVRSSYSYDCCCL